MVAYGVDSGGADDVGSYLEKSREALVHDPAVLVVHLDRKRHTSHALVCPGNDIHCVADPLGLHTEYVEGAREAMSPERHHDRNHTRNSSPGNHHWIWTEKPLVVA